MDSPSRFFWRQILVCSGVWMHYFSAGLIMGAPTVCIPQINKEANSTDAMSEEMSSWISSVFGYAALPWVFILPIMSKTLGRKLSFMFVSFNSMAGFIVFYTSATATQLLISEIILSILMTSNITVSILIFTEYTSPKYRGVFLTLKSATLFWGVWVANAIGTYFHWKYIGILGMVCSGLSFTVFLWPESPFRLATMGRFEDCAASHRWIKGTSKESEEELRILIADQKEYNILRCRNKNDKKRLTLIDVKELTRYLSLNEFRKPLLLSVLMIALFQLSGKTVYSMYAVDILKKITSDEANAYRVMLVLDGITVFGMYTGCLLSKYVKRRPLLLTASSLGIMMLFILSLYLYLIKLEVIVENSKISIVLLMSFSLAISCGPMVMSTSICAELLPLRFKTVAVLITALFNHALLSTVLKVSPYMFKIFGLQKAFLFYAVSSAICILLLYKYLPETKDKTLQEIELYFRGYSHKSKDSKEIVSLSKTHQVI